MKRMVFLPIFLFLIILAFGAPASAAYLQSDPSTQTSMSPYYIGVHAQDGSCTSVMVVAPDFEKALLYVEQRICDLCILENMTPEFMTPDHGASSRAVRLCPLE